MKALVIVEIGPGEHDLSILFEQIVFRKSLISNDTKAPDEGFKGQDEFLELQSFTGIEVEYIEQNYLKSEIQ